jgi:hypothetical protein
MMTHPISNQFRKAGPWLLLALLTAGCSNTSGNLHETLDPQTAITVTAADSPLIFYRDDSARAAHARDFVYVGPVMANNMGRYRYYLWFGIWSAIPQAPGAAERDGFESVTIFADGEPLQLELAGWTPSAIGASEGAYVKPVASAADAYYEVTIDQVRMIADARDLRLLTSGMAVSTFELWDRQEPAFDGLHRFLEKAGY